LIKPYLARPYEVDIELTNACDADCIMCPRKQMRRKVGPMDLSLFKKIVEECVELNVRELIVNGYGEISILKNYKDYLGYIRQTTKSIKIVVNSNGMRMTEDRARFYVDIGVDVVNVAIDGATAETYENIRRHLQLDVVEENVRRLIRIRDESGKFRPLVMVNMLAMSQNRHEIELFKRKWSGVADYAGIAGLVSKTGSIQGAAIDAQNWEQTPCFYLWRQMPILNDGSVALCCDDWDGQANLGNLNNSTIKEIWTNQQRLRLRQLHLQHRAGEIPLCDSCRQPRPGPMWFDHSNGKGH